ncbi:hypothetical protein B0H11DRAFT_2397318 [Mycena galericulata]|nr:hypothetical protein B0H11DRAFT_2397318 [Mycena galericulata]
MTSKCRISVISVLVQDLGKRFLPTVIRDFAQELVDNVLDHTADGMILRHRGDPVGPPSREQLVEVGALGLVCQKWWPRSRVHLFSYVVLCPATVQTFFTLVDTSPSTILALMQTLDLRFDWENTQLLTEGQMLRLRESARLWDLRIQMPDPGLAALEGDDHYSLECLASLERHASMLGAAVP